MYKAMALSAALLCCESSFAYKQRVVSLDLCTDWLLMNIESDHEVTYSRLSASNRPPFQQSRSDEAFHRGSLEDIVALEPDLILVGQFNAWLLRSRLSDLGYRVEVLTLPQSLDDIALQEQHLYELLGLPEPEPLELPAPISLGTEAQRVLKIGANGIATGRNTFESALIERAGFENYIADSGYPTVNLEAIIADPPDRVIFSKPAAPALANLVIQHPIWDEIVSAENQWWSDDRQWSCPGPWTLELSRRLTQWH